MNTKAREVFLYIFLKIMALSLKLDIAEPSDFLSYRDMISDIYIYICMCIYIYIYIN